MGLFLLTALTRIPFRSQFLYHWDSVNLANGMRALNILEEHPQPPGYIVYVWLARAVNVLTRDSNAAMVWLGILGSALAVAALYLLGRELWDRRVGLAAALLLCFSPLFWFYGELALPHTVDTALVLGALWLLARVRRGDLRAAWPAVAVLALAGGVRPQTLVFLLPVALYGLWPIGWRRLLGAALLGTVLCLGWFLPLIASTGGLGPYLAKMNAYGARFQDTTSIMQGAGLAGVAYNVRKLAMYTLYGLSLALVPLAAAVGAGVLRLQQRAARAAAWPKLVFLGLWGVPVFAFYSLIHMGQQGLIFVYLPALLLLAAWGLIRLLPKRRWWPTVVALVVVHAAVFLACPEYPLGLNAQRMLTWETIRHSDHYYGARLAAIGQLDPEPTAILAANWEHARYYLPEYRVIPFEAAQSWADVPAETNGEQAYEWIVPAEGLTLVLFDPTLAAFNRSPEQAARWTWGKRTRWNTMSLPLVNGWC
jgi:NAD(P)-dependent dehydrogenase (short-subunit alcohol dehydrogenase family)